MASKWGNWESLQWLPQPGVNWWSMCMFSATVSSKSHLGQSGVLYLSRLQCSTHLKQTSLWKAGWSELGTGFFWWCSWTSGVEKVKTTDGQCREWAFLSLTVEECKSCNPPRYFFENKADYFASIKKNNRRAHTGEAKLESCLPPWKYVSSEQVPNAWQGSAWH